MGEKYTHLSFRASIFALFLLILGQPGGQPPAIAQIETQKQTGTLTIYGTLSYRAEIDDAEPTHPALSTERLAGAYVEIHDQGSLYPLASTQTDGLGNYEFNLPNNEPNGLDPVLRVYANDSGPSNTAGIARVTQPNGSDYYVDVMIGTNMSSGTYLVNYTVSDADPGGYNLAQAFLIFDLAANHGARLLEAQPGMAGSLSQVKIRWPAGCLNLNLNDSCFTGTIYIHPVDGNRPDVILHEYGHYAFSRAIGSVAGTVFACRSLDPPFQHSLWEESSQTCAWSEGWATFFQMAVQDDSDYFGSSLENVDTPFKMGSVTLDPAAWEGVIAASLWDIFDSSAGGEPWDSFIDGFNGPANNGIWQVTAYDPPGFTRPARVVEEFWSFWYEQRPGDACFGSAILQHHRLPYEPYGYALTTGVQPAGAGTVAVSPAPNCPGGLFQDGTVVNLRADPAAGWSFDYWAGSLNTSANPINFSMNSPKQFTAHFDGSFPTPTPTPSPTATPSPTPSPTLPPGLYEFPIPGELVAYSQTGCTKVQHLIWSGTLPGDVKGLVVDYDFVPTDGLSGTKGSFGSAGAVSLNALFSSTSPFGVEGSDLCFQVPGGVAWCSQAGYTLTGSWGYTLRNAGQFAELWLLTEVNCSSNRRGEHTLTNFRLLAEIGGP